MFSGREKYVFSLFLLLGCFALVPGATVADILAHSTFLDPENKFHVSWDFTHTDITFELQVETLGYVGFGFSPNGGMVGSDIVIGWVNDTNGKAELSDRFATRKDEPVRDERQDYKLHSAEQNSTHTVLRFSRSLELCDERDYRTLTGTVRVIWAFHDSDPDSYNGIPYHAHRRGQNSIFLLNQEKRNPLPDNVIVEEYLMDNVLIQERDTLYWCKSFRVPQFDRKHHLIRAEPVIQPGHEAYVHHMVVYGCHHPITDPNSFNHSDECRQANMLPDMRGCLATIFVWAVGGGSFNYPEHAGYPFGTSDDPTMFVLDVHYDNPFLKAGIRDSSGFRLYYTPDLRDNDAGVIMTGMSVTPFQVIPPHAEIFKTAGHCVPECLNQAMENNTVGVHIFGAFLHSHLAGRAMRLRHMRNGSELQPIAEDNTYDFNLQETKHLEEEILMLPGDHLVTECDYRTTDRDRMVHGGLSTRQEMCLSYILYYPKFPLSMCISRIRPDHLVEFSGLQIAPNWTLTYPPEHAGKSWSSVFDTSQDWSNKTVRDQLEAWINDADGDDYIITCNQGVNSFPVHGQSVSIPKIISTYKRPDNCKVGPGIISDVQMVKTDPLVVVAMMFIMRMLA